jgi:hypothetical protein
VLLFPVLSRDLLHLQFRLQSSLEWCVPFYQKKQHTNPMKFTCSKQGPELISRDVNLLVFEKNSKIMVWTPDRLIRCYLPPLTGA